MRVKWSENKIIVEPSGVEVVNYPLDWIEGLEEFSPDEASRLIFQKPYAELESWCFRTSIEGSSVSKKISYGKRNYAWNHLQEDGGIGNTYIPGKSFFWRGVYFPDLGIYGRLGGAHGKRLGSGRFGNLLNYRNPDGSSNQSLRSRNTTQQLLDSHINFIIPGYLFTPPTDVTLHYLHNVGLKAIFNLGGPKGGQPLPKGTVGIGKLSDLGSVWYNHPKAYVNEYHAPGEKFYLTEQLSLANKYSSVIAIQQQDEPRYTDTYKERYNLIKEHTRKAVFCTFNWGTFYNSNRLRYKIKGSKIIRPIALVTDIYCSNLYIYHVANKYALRDFGDSKSNVWRLVDRHRTEVEELSKELGRSFDKPRWLVLQGYGSRSQKTQGRVVPDPDFMRAQIWATVCLGVTGIAIYLQHTTGSEASMHRIMLKNPDGFWHEGIAPYGPNADTWQAMAEAYKGIARYENALLQETIDVAISSDERILTLLKQDGRKFYLFTVNTYRKEMSAIFDFTVFPGSKLLLANSVSGFKAGSTIEGERHIYYRPFEVKMFELERIQ